MTTHIGVAFTPVEPQLRTNVLVEFHGGFVIIKDSNGSKLASWRAHEVSAKPERETRVLLTAGKDEVFFETEDPAGFISSLEAEGRFTRGVAPTDRMDQAARMGTVHHKDSPGGRELPGLASLREDLDSAEEPVSHQDLPQEPDQSSRQHEKAVQARVLGEIEPGGQAEPRSPRNLLQLVQAGVVDSLYLGMMSWFGFYFMMGRGNGQERLSTAIAGLKEAADRLQELADRLSNTDYAGHADAEPMGHYRDAVDGWGRGMNMLAEGVEVDNQSAAHKGLSLLVEAAATARLVVRRPVYPNLAPTRGQTERVLKVGDALTYLVAASPRARVSRAAMRYAKQPWEQAIIAAGSPFRSF